MNTIYLCGHTGSVNRGCEAILRSTVQLLRAQGQDRIGIMTMDAGHDRKLKLDRQAELISYRPLSFPVRVCSFLRRKLLSDGVWAGRIQHRPLADRIREGDLILNVGGDTYCYGTPNLSYALNDLAREKGIPTVFWGCSVDERLERDGRMREDIGKYAYIVARETVSYERLKKAARDPDRVLLACDPAFWLETEEVPLPEGFLPGNTLGINLSPLVFRDSNDGQDMMYSNVHRLIERVLAETDMHVCLIPHVYGPDRNLEDIRVLRNVYRRYLNEPRVSLEERMLSCTQLKYLISRCRFFIGARTHTVIGAYASAVPAMAISYSVKSIGIAGDLLGSHEDYTVQWKKIDDPMELWGRLQLLRAREAGLREHYAQVLPGYKNSILSALEKIVGSHP